VERAREEYRLKQLEKGRPTFPREPLKRTADNNWVHVYCALWHSELRYSSSTRLDMVEGIGAPTLRYDTTCKVCKTSKGACVSCLQCHANFHVGCAHSAGYVFGFDITPVKATRRDAVPTVTLNGETGSMMAAIWCKEHSLKSVIHPMNEGVEGTDMVALQLFAREFKQADLTLTGTARKANLVDQSTRIIPQTSAPTQGNRRTSTVITQTPTSARSRHSNAGIYKEEELAEITVPKSERKCSRCSIDASPRWWKVEEPVEVLQTVSNVVDGPATINGELSRPAPGLVMPHHEQTPSTNGVIDHPMTDAPAVAPQEQSSLLRVETDIASVRPVSYLCQKCHWRRHNTPDEPEEPERPVSALAEHQQLSLRSPPMQQTFVAPPPPPPAALGGQWATSTQQQPPPLSVWHNGGPPPPGSGGHPPPPHVLHNGVMHVPPMYHGPYNPPHQPNGYGPYPGPPVHAHLPPASFRGPYPPAHPSTHSPYMQAIPTTMGPYQPHHPPNGVPPPLHLTNGGMLANEMRSPHMPYSPTHAMALNSPHPTDGPFGAHPPMQYSPMNHSNPTPRRPSTPRDVSMRDMSAVTMPPPAERISTGASSSPSLRNLLH
jgi:hypothetical protein